MKFIVSNELEFKLAHELAKEIYGSETDLGKMNRVMEYRKMGSPQVIVRKDYQSTEISPVYSDLTRIDSIRMNPISGENKMLVSVQGFIGGISALQEIYIHSDSEVVIKRSERKIDITEMDLVNRSRGTGGVVEVGGK